MPITRRSFIQTTLATAAAAGLGGASALTRRAGAAQNNAPGGGKKILVLGGTRFLGPAIVNAAQARGHTVTLFNRGQTNPGLFPDLEQLQGDRDPLKGKGLKALEGRKWDAVIDTSGYYPRMVKASAELLAPNVGQYIFVSTVSVYASNATPNEDETGTLATIEDPTVEVMGPQYQNYGALKALCEQAVEAALPGRTANVRPGYIVGREDPTDRYPYWPVRIARGGEVLAPGTAADPVQIIDVRDLGEWMVLMVEKNTVGDFNAVGPANKLAAGEMLESCRKATGADATFTWVDPDFLQELKAGVPILIPPRGEYAGFHTRSNARAVKAGLTFRDPVDTAKDTLKWFNSAPEERRTRLITLLDSGKEQEILEAWRASKAG